MARVPTWTELRIDATKLAQLQKECYNSVHHLLDSDISELDRKLMLLNDDHKVIQNLQVAQAPQVTQVIHVPQISQDPQPLPKPIIKSAPRAKKKEKLPKISPPNGSLRDQKQSKYDLSDLEHLRPLPKPLSEYLRANRPDVVLNANTRTMRLKLLAERRKLKKDNSAARIANTLERLRFSSRSGSSDQQKQNLLRNRFMAPEYVVKCKLSEQEMKRRTARNYKRLDEVKKRRQEEVANHLRVQNYKNKTEYGRRLLENRRIGIINYPLRVMYGDGSMDSSLDDYSSNGFSY